MYFTEAGILPRSVRYLITPSSLAERLFFYTTRLGHYFCTRAYHFCCDCDIAMEPGHRLHYMIFQIRQGMLELQLDGKKYTASSGMTVLFDCKRPHEYYALTDDLEFYWMVFDGPTSDLFYSQILLMQEKLQVFSIPDTANIYLLFERLLTYAGLSVRRPERTIAEQIYSMLCLLLVGVENADTIIDRALAYMDKHFAEPLPVDQIAAQVGLSTSHFNKHFRQQTGYSPHEYIILRRIDHAKELLLSTEQTVSQIAYESGYNSEENFIRSFKKKTGVSPATFRQYPV